MARFAVGFVLVTVIGWLTYVTLFFFQLGARTPAEYWIYDATTVKHHLLRTMTEKPKVLLVGGSSVWFGLDAAVIQRALGMATLNLGLHAMRPLDQIVGEVRPALKSGDIVIMPLEFEYYVIDTPYNYWYVSEVMAGKPDVFWRLPWQEKVAFFLRVSPMRVLEGVATRVSAFSSTEIEKRIPGHALEQVLLAMQQVWATYPAPEENYSFRNIDPQGNAILVQGTYTSYVYPLSVQSVAPGYPWRILAEFAEYCTNRGVLLYIGWPPVVAGEVAFDSPFVRDNVQIILSRLTELGIPVLGVPTDFQYDRQFFADSGYHLNHEGRALHTERTLRVLNQKIANHGGPMWRKSSSQVLDKAPGREKYSLTHF